VKETCAEGFGPNLQKFIPQRRTQIYCKQLWRRAKYKMPLVFLWR